MRLRLLSLALLPFFLAGCGGEEDTDGLYDESVDWSEQCGTLMVIAKDDGQTASDQARALDLYSEYC